jgi:hypothetical protein
MDMQVIADDETGMYFKNKIDRKVMSVNKNFAQLEIHILI